MYFMYVIVRYLSKIAQIHIMLIAIDKVYGCIVP